MQIIFYKSNNLASEMITPLVNRFAEKMRASVLIIDNNVELPTPSVIVKDDYDKELFRSSDLPSIKHLLGLQITNITPSVKQLKKYLVPGAIVAAVLATVGIVVYKRRKRATVCACD